MAKSQYLNFSEYAKNDSNYLLKVLRNQLHKTQSKIEFKDGTTYHVTKSGSRYWQKGNYMHREDGPACVWGWDHDGSYYLYSYGFKTYDEYKLALDRLLFLRDQTDNQVDSLVEEIAKNIQWEDRNQLWGSILQGSTDSTAMLAELNKLSKQYQKLSNMSRKFIEQYS